MSDQSAFDFARPLKPRSEYAAYHTIIVLGALPVETLNWTASVLWHRKLPALGPFARARRTADEITPVIFQA